MKKIAFLSMALLICLSLSSCSKKLESSQNEGYSTTTNSETVESFLQDSETIAIETEGSESNNSVETTETPIEEIVESAPYLNTQEFWDAYFTNSAKATLDYDKKLFKVKVTVMNIETKGFEYREFYSNGFMGTTTSLFVEMPIETLATLENGSHIIVLGELDIRYKGNAHLKNAFVVDSSMVKPKNFTDEEIQFAIENYNPDLNGKINWSNGSCPFFIENRLYFEEITEESFFSEMEGTWVGKYYLEPAKSYTIKFTSESTATVSGHTNVWNYSFVNNQIKFPNACNPCEVRKVSDRLIVLYEYTIDYVPRWILYKEK